MKKTARTMMSLLVVLIMLFTLPVSALALEDNTANNATISGPIGTNTGNNVEVAKDGKVDTNQGEIDINEGEVDTNQGKVGVNYGEIGTNEGEIVTNAGEISVNDGKIGTNDGKVDVNLGTVSENSGEVTHNLGVVTNTEDGTLYDVTLKDGWDSESGDYYPEITYSEVKGEGTYVGIFIYEGEIENEGAPNTYFDRGGIFGVVKQVVENAALNLKEVGNMFKKDGYEVIGYQAYEEEVAGYAATSDEDAPNTVYETTYTVSRPASLTLLWKKIQAAAPAATTPTPVNRHPTHVSEDKVKVGTVIQRGAQRFRIIEVTDDSILVATVGKLSQKDLADMTTFLQKFFTDEQMGRLLGDPELLSDELVAKHFGDKLEHICFRAARNLFAP